MSNKRASNSTRSRQSAAAASRSSTLNLSIEFAEFTRKQMLHYQKMFKRFDFNNDSFIDVEDLSQMSVKLQLTNRLLVACTDTASMIAEVDEDGDGKMNLREFLLIFRKGSDGSLRHPGLVEVYRQMYMADGDTQENADAALTEFKEQIIEWSRSEAK